MPTLRVRGGTVRVGISGWTYPPWRGTFYPEKIARHRELAYAAGELNSIEINGTFYGLQKPPTFAAWHAQTPADFVFAVKAPRFITHVKRLREVETPVANFLLSGVLRLGEKLGPILWQLPPNLQFDPDVMAAFLAALPHSTKDAAKRAKKCDARMKGRTWADVDVDRTLRHAVEIRHESFATAAFVKLLRKHGVAVVIADTAGQWPMLHDVTADFAYLRLHGAVELYQSGYTDPALRKWATTIKALAAGGDASAGPGPGPGPGLVRRIGPVAAKRAKRDVYVYFDNDVKVRSPFDAARLAVKLGLRAKPLAVPDGIVDEVQPQKRKRPKG